MNRQRRWSSRFAVRAGTFWLLDRNWVEGCFAVANASGVSACVCACAARLQGEAQAQAQVQGQAGRAAAARDLLLLPG